MSKTDLMKKVLDSISANATPKKTGSRTWCLVKTLQGCFAVSNVTNTIAATSHMKLYFFKN